MSVEIRAHEESDRVLLAVEQIARAEVLGEAVRITYQPLDADQLHTEDLCVTGIASSRGGHQHQLVVTEPGDPDEQLWTIPLWSLVSVEGIQ